MSRSFSKATAAAAALTGANQRLLNMSVLDALQTIGIQEGAVTEITATQTLNAANFGTVLVNATSGNIVLTLPASGTATDNARFTFVRSSSDVSANTVTVTRAGSDTIDGATSITLGLTQRLTIELTAGGTVWRVISRHFTDEARAREALGSGVIGNSLFTATTQASARAVIGLNDPIMRNLFINSDGFINQRSSATSVADAAYGLFDRCYSLHESGNVTLSRLNQPTDGIPYAMRILQPDVTAKRIGMAQAVEARDCLAYRGSQLVFAPKLRLSVAANVRVALLAHTGTADTITRDVVGNWSSGTYTPGNFFIGTNLTVIAVGSASLTANTWTDVVASSANGGVVAPSGMNNLIMMWWTESAVAQNVTLDASQMRCGLGTQVPIWTPPDAATELARARRFFETGFVGAVSYAASASAIQRSQIVYQVQKRVAPSLTFAFDSGTLNQTAGVVASYADFAWIGWVSFTAAGQDTVNSYTSSAEL